MTERSAFLALGDERFVALTTYRRDGTPVTAPVWVARSGDALIVTTPDDTGKLKRLRRNDIVQLQPCGRRGAIKPGTVALGGRAEIRSAEEEATERHRFRSKYGLEYRAFMLIERLIKRVNARRLLLRITPEGE